MVEEKEKYDIVLIGATGFTGGIICDYMTKYLMKDNDDVAIKFAIAGRTKEKLEKIKDEILKKYKKDNFVSDIGIIVANANDVDSLEAMVKQTKVIMSTMGPFLKYGKDLVKMCVKHKVHYCDITGETMFAKDNIDKYHEQAEKDGTHIVSMSGFDSLPSDLGALMTYDNITNTLNKECGKIKAYVQVAGTASGGTLSTMLHIMSLPKKELKKSMHPYYLNDFKDDKEKKLKLKSKNAKEEKDIVGISKNKAMKKWNFPFLMASVNTRVVRRSASLLNYGDNFSYNECSIGGFLTAFIAGILMQILFLVLILVPPARRLLAKTKFAQPGAGPSEKKRAKSKFKMTFIGYDKTNKKELCRTIVRGGDPGYTETAKMLTETAICLAKFQDKLARKGGVLTPASSGGKFLIKRLNENTTLSFKVEK